MSDLHHEKHLEAYIVQKLTDQGWLLGSSAGYDQDYALYPEDIEEWLKATQPSKWDRLATERSSTATPPTGFVSCRSSNISMDIRMRSILASF